VRQNELASKYPYYSGVEPIEGNYKPKKTWENVRSKQGKDICLKLNQGGLFWFFGMNIGKKNL
jgi:hypothetical protein